MEKLKKTLKNKNGESYIYLCVIILFVSLLLSVIILYMGLMAQVRVQKHNTKARLDGYVTESAVNAFNDLKQGENYANTFDWAAFENGVYETLGFEDDKTLYEHPNGTKMTRPTVTVLRGEGFGIKIEYVAIYLVNWNGNTYADLEIPITIVSYYKGK